MPGCPCRPLPSPLPRAALVPWVSSCLACAVIWAGLGAVPRVGAHRRRCVRGALVAPGAWRAPGADLCGSGARAGGVVVCVFSVAVSSVRSGQAPAPT